MTEQYRIEASPIRAQYITRDYLQNLAESPPVETSLFQQRMLEVMERGEPIMYERYMFNGDSLILTHCLRTIAEKFAALHTISHPVRLQSYSKDQESTYSELDPFIQTQLLGYEDTQAKMAVDMTIQEGAMRELSILFGVPYEQEALLPPRPQKLDYGPLLSYNEEAIISQGRAIRTRMNEQHRSLILLYQAGTDVRKRLSTYAIAESIPIIRAIRKNAYIVLVTDDYSCFRQYPAGQENPDETNTYPHLTDLGALAYAADGIFGTDTFWAWFSTG